MNKNSFNVFCLLTSTIFIINSSLGKTVYILMDKKSFHKLEANNKPYSKKRPEIESKSDYITFKMDDQDLLMLSKQTHKALHTCGGFKSFYNPFELQDYMDRSINIQVTENLHLMASLGKDPFVKEVNSLSSKFSQSNIIDQWFGQIERPKMNKMIEKLTSYKTRYYKSPEGIAAMNWIHEQWKEITKIRSDVTLTKFKHSNFEQPSIILSFKGATNPQETLVFGGHGDSINTDDGPKGIAPGADDNAAGVALLTEIIRLIVENNYQPNHTLTFMVYAAEEVGILGSYEITKSYRKNKINVTGALMFDGVNFQGKTFEMALISDFTNKTQNEYVGALIDEYIQVPWTYQKCGYPCSDHGAWSYEGYPVSFPVETIATEQNPHFHTKRDTFDKSNFDTVHAEKFLKLGLAFLLEKDAK